ncbi:MAG: YbbR-like domain-containing protein [Polyangiaceae bacterium]
MSKRSRARSVVGQLVLNNFWLKAISVFCALAFYNFIHSAQHAQRTLKVALVAEMPSPDAARFLVTKLPATVDVTIAGPRQQIAELRGVDLELEPIDLTKGLDVARLGLTPAMITGLTPAVRVLKIVPPMIETRFEDQIPRHVAIHTKSIGSPAKGMQLKGSIKLEPLRVVATGPRSAVEVLQVVVADSFDITGLGGGTHTRRLALTPPPTGVDYDPMSVLASLEIHEERAQVVFKDVTVEVLGLKLARVKPPRVEVFVDGPPKLALALKKKLLVAYVDPKKEGEDLPATGKALFDVKLVVEGVDVQIKPKQVLVTW